VTDEGFWAGLFRRWHEALAPLAPQRLPLLAAGALLALAGSWLPWAGFAGFPGKMTLAYPGGARTYTLVLALFAVAAYVLGRDRRRAGEAAALGVLGIALFTTLAIANDGGGLVNVAYGAWLTVVGGLLLLVSFGAAQRDEEPPVLPDGPAYVRLPVVVGVFVLLLLIVVEALKIEASSQFIALLVLLAFALLTLRHLGAVAWFQRASDAYRPVVVGAGLLAAVVFPFTQGGSDYWIRVGASVGVFAATAVGLNIVVGLAGLLDLGYVAFFGVGAYVGASFAGAPTSNAHVHLPFILVVVVGATVASVFGLVIGAPTLRLRGDYLAIVTLGFGEIFRIAANNLDGRAGPKITNGPNGIPGIPNLKTPSVSPLGIKHVDFGATHTVFGIKLGYFANYFFAELVLLAVIMLIFVRLNQSRIGRAWVAIREDEVAATAMGINTIRLKLLAFAIGAFLAGAAGTVNAHLTTQVSPDSYTFNESILLLAAVVLGGMGTIGGALLGSAAIVVLPEKLRFFSDYRILIFGAALVLMMRFRPEGIVPNQRRRREFHEAGGGADATSAPPGSPVAST
jgi:branched-chain amino acid transport system permease protein